MNNSCETKLKFLYLPVYPWSHGDHPTKFGGLMEKMIILLTSKLNICYETIESQDWAGLMKTDGKWGNIFQKLKNNEYDILLGPIIASSAQVDDFRLLPAYYNVPSFLTLASTSTEKPSNFFSFLATFNIEIWYWILITLVILIIVSSLNDYVLCNHLGLQVKESLSTIMTRYFWTFLAGLFSEGSPRSPSFSSNRIILAFWLLGMIVLLNSFSGQFKALLLVNSEGDMMKDASDLAKRRDLMPQFPDYYSFYECFQETEMETYKSLWKNILRHGVTESVFPISEFVNPTIYQRVKDGGAVIIADPTIIKINFSKLCHGLKGSRIMYHFDGVCFPWYFVFAVSPAMEKSQYLALQTRIRWMLEGHLIQKWIDDESRDLWKCFLKPEYSEATPLSMNNLFGAFALLMMLQCASFFVLLGEILHSKIQKSKSRKKFEYALEKQVKIIR